MQLQHRMRVFGHGFSCDAADLVQRRAADDRAGAAEESCVPVIVPILQQAVEHVALGRHAAAGGEVPLEGIGRVKVMRRLHQCQLVVFAEPSHRQLQE